MSKLEKALNRYYENFGENYPLCISENRSTDEIISDIDFCICTGSKAEGPSYEEDADY